MEEKVAKPQVSSYPVPEPEQVLKASSDPQSPQTSKKPTKSAAEEVQAMITGTEDDMAGRYIPMGEPAEDPMFQAVARYFDIHERDFKDASHDLEFIIQYVTNDLGVHDTRDLDKILPKLRELEDRLRPTSDFDAKRYQRLYNYLILREKVDAMDRALSALEKSRYGNEGV
jgi:hypothetical protein